MCVQWVMVKPQTVTTLGNTVNWLDKAYQISLLFNVVPWGTVCFPGQTKSRRGDTAHEPQAGSATRLPEGLTSSRFCAVKLPSRTFTLWAYRLFCAYFSSSKEIRENVWDKVNAKFHLLGLGHLFLREYHLHGGTLQKWAWGEYLNTKTESAD